MTITREYISFFKNLKGNNNAEWFNGNKKLYEEHVKKPFHQLVHEVIHQMKKLDPLINIEAKDCIFRINRDVRFSADKNPYKLYMSAVVSRQGKKDSTYPGIYFHLGASELSIVGGTFEPPKEALLKIRKAIAKDSKRINKILAAAKFKDLFGGFAGDQYKVLPAEFKDIATQTPAMYQKSFHFEKNYKGESYITRPDLAGFIVDHYKAADEVNRFLSEALTSKG